MEELQRQVEARGKEIFRLMETEKPAVFDRRRLAGLLMEAAMADPELKVRLFRFIDVLPTLSSSGQIAAHIREYLLDPGSTLPPLLKRLLRGIDSPLTAGITAAMVKKNIVAFSRIFIAGESADEAVAVMARLWEEGSPCTVDILGEAALSEKEALRYLDLYLSLADTLAREMEGWPPIDPQMEELFPRLNISVKPSSLFSRIGPVNYRESVSILKERLRPIFSKVKGLGGFVNLDMEMHSLKGITIDAFTGLMEEEEFCNWQGAGLALQAYLRESADDLERLVRWGEEKGRRITIRLVKGAYWEYETVVARQRGWPLPVFSVKGHSDWNFERCAEVMLENAGSVVPAFATHNVRSLAFVMACAERHGVPTSAMEFQMLYGMAEPVKRAARSMGYSVREYAPMGELIPGMAYLVRRLLENSSNEGFLRRTFVAGESRESLLGTPPTPPAEAPSAPEPGRGAFRNEPPLDFSLEENREACRRGIEGVRGDLARLYPAVIGGEERRTSETIVSVNPASPGEVLGSASAVGAELALEAVAAARSAQPAWERRPAAERAGYLFRAAEMARGRRFELIAWQLLEAGKSLPEADADVIEAIDYLDYYGREMIRLAEPLSIGEVPGESNRYIYRPRGVALVIAPWNFPLAISAGMTAAALVSGNTVIYKPSSLTVANGWQLFDLFRQAGLPPGVLNLLPCRGETVGQALVDHPGIDLIAFTGSREVGLGIVERGARCAPGQRSVKRVIAEMGGKNAVIVDTDADMDQAVGGILQSAFGYQGQKCSACSRAIVLAGCYDRFLERLVETVRGIRVGPPDDPANFVGPLIELRSVQRFEEYLGLARSEGKVAVQAKGAEGGFYAPPTVVTDLPPTSRILKEEIFAPILAVIRVQDMDEALAVANDCDYALTGGLFSRTPSIIERVSREFAVGNLYINRGITGAVVGRQPFGGFRLSGIGSKAGGPDYLKQFMEPRVITENTVRRGFTPEVIS